MPSDLPTGVDRTRAELLARLAALRSLLTVKRFIWKVGFFSCFAAAQAAAGNGFLRHLAAFALLSTVVSVIVAHWRREEVNAPHYTSFDEAAWFMLLAIVARGAA